MNQILKLIIAVFLFFLSACQESGTEVSEGSGTEENWRQIASFPELSVHAVTQNLLGELYVGNGSGIFVSQNQGMNWQHVSNNMPIKTLQIDQSSGLMTAVISAGPMGYSSLRISPNFGATWYSPDSGLAGEVRYIEVLNDSILIAGGEVTDHSSGGIYRSNDFGKHWTKSVLGEEITVRGIAESSPGELYITLSGNLNGLYKSDDKGQNWQKVDTDTSIAFWGRILINSLGHLVVESASAGIFRSEDNGRNWKRLGNHPVLTGFMAIDSDDNIVIASIQNSGLEHVQYWSVMDSTWKHIAGLPEVRITTLFVDPGRIVYIGTMQDKLYRTNQPLAAVTAE